MTLSNSPYFLKNKKYVLSKISKNQKLLAIRACIQQFGKIQIIYEEDGKEYCKEIVRK